ncbi:hypothetical protein BS78_02G229700 [Paspalum vaginatum]|nr:hypothetical protein BS78_02G229700 [Paspalum vaginatum]
MDARRPHIRVLASLAQPTTYDDSVGSAGQRACSGLPVPPECSREPCMRPATSSTSLSCAASARAVPAAPLLPTPPPPGNGRPGRRERNVSKHLTHHPPPLLFLVYPGGGTRVPVGDGSSNSNG